VAEDFPRQVARTRNFTLGVPRDIVVSPDGARVVFLRTRTGQDPVTCLWVLDVATGEERVVFDPSSGIGAGEEAELSAAERARRERVRELAGGVVAYATDRSVRRAVFSMGTSLFLTDLETGETRVLPSPGAIDDPRLDPVGNRVAYVMDGALHVLDIDGGDRTVAADEDPDVTWGLPEFVAAEEMDRLRGHWWSPDGTRLAAARVDERPVGVWHITDPTDPSARPRAVRYPAAGTADAIVTVSVFAVPTGDRVHVAWDREAFPYLARVDWSEGAPLTLLVMSRDQRRTQLLEVDHTTGLATVVTEDADPHWIDLPEDAPVRLQDGRTVTVVADAATDTNRLRVGSELVTPPGLQVRRVLSADDGVLFTASDEPTEIHLWRWTGGAGAARISSRPGAHTGAEGGDVTVLVSSTLEQPLPEATILRKGEPAGTIRSVADGPAVEPKPVFVSLGDRELRGALLLPGGREPDGTLPVLLDPYGGPHGPRVFRAAGPFLTSQWFADNGFAVLVVDGRGTGGRGPAWDRSIHHDFTLALEDQVDALQAGARRFPFLDLSRVAIRGWSFGGYLAALAVLRRPEVFHAAVAGAPVTDWRLYDTMYTERYLGTPQDGPDVYRRNSILREASRLERPLMLIHGLADDNVVVANTLKLSAALFEAGKQHELVLLPALTHLSRSEAATENLLRIQVRFLKAALGLEGS
jgi:dipeptidyl-peptidase 4